VRRFVRDIEFQWDAQLRKQFEYTAELHSRLAMLYILRELFADPSGTGQIVNADATLAANSAYY
jgi:hypothetical protein